MIYMSFFTSSWQCLKIIYYEASFLFLLGVITNLRNFKFKNARSRHFSKIFIVSFLPPFYQYKKSFENGKMKSNLFLYPFFFSFGYILFYIFYFFFVCFGNLLYWLVFGSLSLAAKFGLLCDIVNLTIEIYLFFIFFIREKDKDKDVLPPPLLQLHTDVLSLNRDP